MKKKDFLTKFISAQPETLRAEIAKLNHELHLKTTQLAINQEKNTAVRRTLRRQIAWLNTILSARKLQIHSSPLAKPENK